MADTFWIFTHKEGLLSRVAHDLRLRVDGLRYRLDGEAVEVEVDSISLRVDGVMREGLLRPDELSGKDRAEIERSIRDTVLQSSRYPQVHFHGRLQAGRVEGELNLRGRSLPLIVPVQTSEGRARGTIELQPTRWGIEPYRALLGAIRLQDRVGVAFDIQLPGA